MARGDAVPQTGFCLTDVNGLETWTRLDLHSYFVSVGTVRHQLCCCYILLFCMYVSVFAHIHVCHFCVVTENSHYRVCVWMHNKALCCSTTRSFRTTGCLPVLDPPRTVSSSCLRLLLFVCIFNEQALIGVCCFSQNNFISQIAHNTASDWYCIPGNPDKPKSSHGLYYIFQVQSIFLWSIMQNEYRTKYFLVCLFVFSI